MRPLGPWCISVLLRLLFFLFSANFSFSSYWLLSLGLIFAKFHKLLTRSHENNCFVLDILPRKTSENFLAFLDHPAANAHFKTLVKMDCWIYKAAYRNQLEFGWTERCRVLIVFLWATDPYHVQTYLIYKCPILLSGLNHPFNVQQIQIG